MALSICVYGAASPRIDEKYTAAAEALGESLARRGHGMVFGAGARGLMGAAARGAKRGGAHIHGIIPRFFKDEDIESIYPECDELTLTEDMRERKRLMEESAEAFIILPGGIGTYEEFFEILTLKQLGRHEKPIVIYNAYGYYDSLIAAMREASDEGFILEKCLTLFVCAGSADEAVLLAEETGGCDYSVSELKEG